MTLIVFANFPRPTGRELDIEGPPIDSVHLPFFVETGKQG